MNRLHIIEPRKQQVQKRTSTPTFPPYPGDISEKLVTEYAKGDVEVKNTLEYITMKDTGYVMGKKLGAGGFGAVYEVQKRRGKDKTIYAGKFIKIPTDDNAEYRRNESLKEFEMGEKLYKACGDTYVKVIEYFDYLDMDDIERGLQGEYFLIIMEKLRGEELYKWYTRNQQEPNYKENMSTYVNIGYCFSITMANALICLHKEGFIYNDFKGENVFISFKIDNVINKEVPVFKLLDLGLACKYTDNNLPDYPCKNAGNMCFDLGTRGTPITRAPEVFKCKNGFVKSDSWSVGITLYESIFGDLVEKVDEQDGNITIYPNYTGNMLFLKKNFTPMYVILSNLIRVDPQKRWSMLELLEYTTNNKNIDSVLCKKFNIKPE